MTAACPADCELERLLVDQLSKDEEVTLEVHVAGCADCQARLDLLTRSPLTLETQPHGNLPDYEGTRQRAGVLQRVAGLLSSQLRLLEQEYALGGGNGTGRNNTSAQVTGPRFTVLGPHAEGGLGRVHLARDEQLRRTVALKEIRPERADDPRVRQRFLNEAEITGQLEHPGIVPIYALESDGSRPPVYAMRFIQGRTLGEAIKAHHRGPTALGLRELLQRFISVCQTVAYAHSKGVIHRDLKPDNVMLGDYGETLVVDWGLAKRLGDRDDSFDETPTAANVPPGQLLQTVLDPTTIDPAGGARQLTAAGTVMGTPAYMAPEQARGELLSPAADVYALGAMLFTLLTGKVPHQGTSTIEVLRKVAEGKPPEVTGLPRALKAIYSKAMARDPRERYASAAELALDVDCWLADERVSACRERWPDRAGRWIRQHRTLAASLGVAAGLLLVVAVGVGWWQVHLAEKVRLEDDRQLRQINALLDRGEAAVKEENVAGAWFAIDHAEKLAENLRSKRPADRLVRCREAADLLAHLERIDDLLWDLEEGRLNGPERAVREWPGAFKRLGVTLGQTSEAEAACAVNGSLARERLLAALDQWLVYAATQDRAVLAGILAAADPDLFRDAIRAAIQRADWESVKALALRDDALNQPARFAAALGLIPQIPRERRLTVLWRSAQARPQAYVALMTAGFLYASHDSTTAADRIAWFRSAVTARPDRCVAHSQLGRALMDKGDPDGAIAEYRTTIALEPTYANAHNNLAIALLAKKDPDGAIAEYRVSLMHDPKSASVHNNLGMALAYYKGDLDGAIAEYRSAISLNEEFASAHNNLGYVLKKKGDLLGAIAEFRTASQLDPNKSDYRYHLGNALRATGDLDGSVAAYQEANKLAPRDNDVSENLAETKRWRALLPRLNAVADGKSETASAADTLDFINLCQQPFVKNYAAAARLYARAITIDSACANDIVARYEAARCAALAGCGLGADAPSEASARASLREQALSWLMTNRKLLEGRLASGNAKDRKEVAEQLSACLAEKDLAEVRPGAARVGWSPSEVAAWDAYWSDIHALLAKTNEAIRSSVPDE